MLMALWNESIKNKTMFKKFFDVAEQIPGDDI